MVETIESTHRSAQVCKPTNPKANIAHNWTIETPRGATSQGQCKNCGMEREFRNSSNDHPWENHPRAIDRDAIAEHNQILAAAKRQAA